MGPRPPLTNDVIMQLAAHHQMHHLEFLPVFLRRCIKTLNARDRVRNRVLLEMSKVEYVDNAEAIVRRLTTLWHAHQHLDLPYLELAYDELTNSNPSLPFPLRAALSEAA